MILYKYIIFYLILKNKYSVLSFIFYDLFGSLEKEESRGEESSGEENRDEWLSSILFGCF